MHPPRRARTSRFGLQCEPVRRREAGGRQRADATLSRMAGDSRILQAVRSAAAQRILFLPHAVRQMSRPDRMISAAEVRHAVRMGKVIEEYPDDPRGPSCLILGFGKGGRSIHVVCSPKSEYLAIITAYVPSETEWTDNFGRRKQR